MSCLNMWWHDNVWGREAVLGWYDQLRFENNPIWCVWTCGDMIMYEEERQQLVGMTRPAEMERGMQAFSRSRNVIVSPGDKTAREEKYENMARRHVHNKGSLQSLECSWNLPSFLLHPSPALFSAAGHIWPNWAILSLPKIRPLIPLDVYYKRTNLGKISFLFYLPFKTSLVNNSNHKPFKSLWDGFHFRRKWDFFWHWLHFSGNITSQYLKNLKFITNFSTIFDWNHNFGYNWS